MAVEPGTTELDPENTPEIEDLVSVCAGLVVVDSGSAIIRLVHYTTQEYLERIMEQWKPDALEEIASACLTYLCFDAFKGGRIYTYNDWGFFDRGEEYEERLQRHVFLDYAANHWGKHASKVEDHVYEQICSLLRHEGSLSCVAQVRTESRMWNGYEGSFWHLLAELGLSITAEKLLPCQDHERDIIVNNKHPGYFTPLYIATRCGHLEMVKFLLSISANATKQLVEDESILRIAASDGFEEIVRLLLDSAPDQNCDAAFWEASRGGHEQTVKLLLQKGANVNYHDFFDDTALVAASSRNDGQIVKLLIEKGADINQETTNRGTVLMQASSCNAQEIVKLLIEKGANINQETTSHGTALIQASSCNAQETVKLLIENGADINQETSRGTALTVASSRGRRGIIKLLLKNGADINKQSGLHGTALTAASQNGREKTVRLLLKNGADVTASRPHHLIDTALEANAHEDNRRADGQPNRR